MSFARNLRTFLVAGLATGYLLLGGAVQAAEASLELDNDHTVTLRTNTDDGRCQVEGEIVLSPPSMVVYVTCMDSGVTPPSIVSANSRDGCTDIQGLGLCADSTPEIPITDLSSDQLSCPAGVTYNVSTGDSGGSCTKTEGNMHCASGQFNESNASCSGGCGNTAGAGCCCQSGTSGCGTGTNCHT